MNERLLREAVVATARAMNQANLNRGKSGNISARCEDEFLITPTGMPYDALIPEDIVAMNRDGQARDIRKPSSEWRFHRDIYLAHAQTGAIVHAHAPFATALACHRRDIPPFHYMIARFGGNTIRCAAYATYGTQALSDSVLHALKDRSACLMSNHGMIVLGNDLPDALDRAIEFEALCEHYWRASTIGTPVLLTDTEMQEVLAKFSSYGKQDSVQT